MEQNYVSLAEIQARPLPPGFDTITGPLPHSLLNDLMFRIVFEANQEALKSLLCSLLHLEEEEIKELVITNPIRLGETPEDKIYIYDIYLLLNNQKKIHLELQVVRQDFWTDRSLCYLCRDFGKLNAGEAYDEVKPITQIDIIDFDLYKGSQEFYSTYHFSNDITGRIYSDKVTLHVLELNKEEHATSEDKAYSMPRTHKKQPSQHSYKSFYHKLQTNSLCFSNSFFTSCKICGKIIAINTKEDTNILYERILSEAKTLDKQISTLQAQLNTLPEGKLICTRNKNRYKWYRSNGKNVTYLPKSQRHLAEQLAYKKYLTLALEDATHEKRALEFYLRHHSQNYGEAVQQLTKMPEYQNLLSCYFTPLNQELLTWMNSPYEHNNKFPEQLTFHTKFGYPVRSKSELLIDLSLHNNKIPFRYECALVLGDSTIFPDFTIRHPKNGITYYWEHFGLMDDPAYCKKACSKLSLYTTNGIIPNIHLITTYETKQHPLDAKQIDTIIQTYFK